MAAAVPSVVLGPAAISITAGVAMILLLVAVPPSRWCPRFAGAVGSPVGVLLGVVFLCWLPSLFVTLSLSLTLEALSWTLGFTVAAVAVWSMLTKDARAAWLVPRGTLVASCVAAAIACTSLYVLPEVLSLSRFQGWIDQDPVPHLRRFANAIVLLVPAVIWAGWTIGGWARGAGIACAAALTAAVLATDVSAPLSGFAAAALVSGAMMLMHARPRLAYPIAVSMFVCLVVGAVVLINLDVRPVEGVAFEPYLPTALFDVHRQAIWAFTLGHGLDVPVFGHGINAVDQVPGAGDLIPGLGQSGEYLPSHPHSWLIEVFAETGLVGTVPLLVFIGAYMVSLARIHIRTGCRACLAACAVSAGYWASGLFNFSFWEAWWQLSHLLLLALLLSGVSPPGRGSMSAGTRTEPLRPPPIPSTLGNGR